MGRIFIYNGDAPRVRRTKPPGLFVQQDYVRNPREHSTEALLRRGRPLCVEHAQLRLEKILRPQQSSTHARMFINPKAADNAK